ncbi:Histone deacetylase 8 [Ananas comosus]|uniref:Histone deacetylase 8 n=1 Tax=Ananas comosus TaxID=4615 RepID=A0A199VJ54_ANACO|nr:Histone deacetylase 8 [Ananas comosus]
MSTPPATSSSSSSSSPPPPPHLGHGDAALDVFWDEGMLGHDAGAGVFDTGADPGFLDVLDRHPENADRVLNMLSVLRRGPIAPLLSWRPGRPAAKENLFI